MKTHFAGGTRPLRPRRSRSESGNARPRKETNFSTFFRKNYVKSTYPCCKLDP